MRKKLQLIKKTIIFGIAVMLASCSEDLYEEANNSSSDFKITNISLKDPIMLKNKLLTNELKRIKNRSIVSNSKIVYDSVYNFYFDDENGIKIEKGNLESYTFQIFRTNSDNKIENIFLSKNVAKSDYDIFLVKYDFTQEDFLTLTTEELNKKKTQIIDCNTGDTNNADADDPCDDWIEVSQSPRYFKVMLDPCDDETGGGTGGDSSGGGYNGPTGPTGLGEGTGSSGGSNTPNTSPILTTPVFGGGLNNSLANPCKKVKEQTNKYQNLKPSLINLATTTTQSHENGFYVDDTATSTTANPINNLSSNAGGSLNIPYLPNPKKYSVLAHTHDASGSDGNGTFSIFSFGDLQKIAQLITLNQIDESFVFFVSTADGTNYALTIDWPSKFAEYFDERKDTTIPLSITNRDYEKAKKMFNKEEEYYKNQPAVGKITRNSNPADDKKLFLTMMKELKLDISIFEVTDNFNTFSKLQLKKGIVTATPCN